MIRRNRTEPGVVHQVDAQTRQASELATIEGQDLLTDPRTNPATRGHADRLRDDQQRRALELDHRRAVRRGRVSDGRGAAAERALEAITAARETASPARSVLALTRTRTRYMLGCLIASVLCSVGAAMSIETWLSSAYPAAPTGLGYLVETGLTVLATSMILLRGQLGTVRGAAPTQWRAVALWGLITVPLAVSLALSTAGTGPVGAACSGGAAAWALAAALASDTLSTAIATALARVDRADEAELRREAMGEDLTTSAPGPGRSGPDRWVSDQADVAADQIAAWLADQDPPAGGSLPAADGPDADGPHGATETPGTEGDHIESAQGEDARAAGGHIDRVAPAVTARRETGQSTRQRVSDYMAEHPDATVPDIARGLDLGETTVKRHRRALREGTD